MTLQPDDSKLAFYSGWDIDKVVSPWKTVTYTNDGATGTDSQVAKIQTDTITNPYGKKCFIRFKWSIDGTNFNTPTTKLLYGFTITITSLGFVSSPLQGLRAAVSCGVSDSTIYFVTGNGYHGNVTRTNPDAADSYTPISQTFTIEYALVEIE